MKRNFFLGTASGAAFAAVGVVPFLSKPARAAQPTDISPGTIVAAFVVSRNANVMDIAGPWETFQDVALADGREPFRMYTVAESTDVVTATGGLQIAPSCSFGNAPKPDVVVIGAQSGHTDAMLDFIRDAHANGAIVMSVCTGAFKLAMTGLLDGKRATTHHLFYDKFARQFPQVTLVRGERFIDDGSIITAGGLTSGIQGAMHVVGRLFGDDNAAKVARYMEFVPTKREE